MPNLPRALFALLLCFCTLALPAQAKKKEAKPETKSGASHTPSGGAAPSADKKGVYQVFGGGKRPAIYTPTNIVDGVWPKSIAIAPSGKKHDIKMAWDDAAIAKAQGRVFEGANPFKLKNSVYTFVILEDGTTSFGNPVDETELGTRHAHLAHGRPVVASGELAKSNDGLRLNFLSGTYMVPLLKEGKVDPHKLREHITTWFDKVLRAKYHPSESFKVVFKVTKPDSPDHNWGNDKIFEIMRFPDEKRLPPPSFCDLQQKVHACDAKFGFAKRNADFCKLVLAERCSGSGKKGGQ